MLAALKLLRCRGFASIIQPAFRRGQAAVTGACRSTDKQRHTRKISFISLQVWLQVRAGSAVSEHSKRYPQIRELVRQACSHAFVRTKSAVSGEPSGLLTPIGLHPTHSLQHNTTSSIKDTSNRRNLLGKVNENSERQ
ncbi:transcriptional activator protein [Pseudozyma hubeiensis SY62]|uniref:Transcriptional activator protein n=1 Tax=Pseudozyma hubeiensis (strain SY62) TaxID=1305764 RepID=R9P2M8_PSEHS|nr:transcriptional activator protein [Pseudozyma hubeiensis SY62]GAC95586.1 transcriptional activator protein [Pseudozyma hubeiensis SY62]